VNNYVFQGETLDGFGMNLEASPWHSWWWLLEEFCVSKSSALAGTEFLLLKQYMLTVAEKLQEARCIASMKQCLVLRLSHC